MLQPEMRRAKLMHRDPGEEKTLAESPFSGRHLIGAHQINLSRCVTYRCRPGSGLILGLTLELLSVTSGQPGSWHRVMEYL